MEDKGLGKKKINFRLKDWGVSRQRYWGCPIPIVYKKDGEAIAVEKKKLPVLLPDDVDLNVSGNPLEKHPNWKFTSLSSGEEVIRETDTLDTFVDSSWYFLRFCSPQYEKYGYKIDDIKDLKISDNIISYKRENWYHKFNLLTGNSYSIFYESTGGATTLYAKCIYF